MEKLFADIASLAAQRCNRIVAFHNAVVDVVWKLPMTISEYAERIRAGEQRLEGASEERLGGGAINFALAASAFRKKGMTVFAGFADDDAASLIRQMNREDGLLALCSPAKPRRNHVLEFSDANAVHHQDISPSLDVGAVLRAINMSASQSDWFASCSFSKSTTFPLLGRTSRFFLDSGYGLERREKRLLTELCLVLKGGGFSYSDFIIATNGKELDNMADEFGTPASGRLDCAKAMAEELSARSGTRIRLLLHTSSYAAVLEPGQEDRWLVPSFDISVKRRTNAGDTFAGAFLAAYDAVEDFRPAVFFANAATAKRISDDEMPSKENVIQFLKMAALKPATAERTETLGIDRLRSITRLRKV